MIEMTNQRVIRQDYIIDAARSRTVLDIGCVAPNQLLELHRQVKAVAKSCLGMDLTAAEGVVVADAQNFDLGQFDLIVAGEIIEHLGDLRGFFSSAARNLLPGGRLIITTPNPYSLLALRYALLGKQVPNDSEHVTLLDATVLGNLVRNFGNSFTGKLFYYEERGYAYLPYRINRWVSRVLPRMACGLLLDLRRI